MNILELAYSLGVIEQDTNSSDFAWQPVGDESSCIVACMAASLSSEDLRRVRKFHTSLARARLALVEVAD